MIRPRLPFRPAALSAALFALALPLQAETPASQPVTLRLTIDPAALTHLQEQGELVMIAAYYYGDATPAAAEKADEMGRIFLGAAELTIWPGEQTITLLPVLDQAPVKDVVAPMLNLNVFSARISGEDNLLDCGFLDDTLAVLASVDQTVACKLIE